MNGGLTLDHLNTAMRLLRAEPEAPHFSGRINVSRFYPKHPTRTYRVIYQAHPLVVRACWILRRWIRINPWTVCEYPDDQDPCLIFGQLYCGPRHYSLLTDSLSARHRPPWEGLL